MNSRKYNEDINKALEVIQNACTKIKQIEYEQNMTTSSEHVVDYKKDIYKFDLNF